MEGKYNKRVEGFKKDKEDAEKKLVDVKEKQKQMDDQNTKTEVRLQQMKADLE